MTTPTPPYTAFSMENESNPHTHSYKRAQPEKFARDDAQGGGKFHPSPRTHPHFRNLNTITATLHPVPIKLSFPFSLTLPLARSTTNGTEQGGMKKASPTSPPRKGWGYTHGSTLTHTLTPNTQFNLARSIPTPSKDALSL